MLTYEVFEGSTTTDPYPKRRIVFMHGWRDRLSLFRPYCEALSLQGYECINVVFPGSDEDVKKPFDEGGEVHGFVHASAELHRTLQELWKDDPDFHFTFIGYGLGCAVGYMYQRVFHGRITRIIALEYGVRQRYLPLITWCIHVFILVLVYLSTCTATTERTCIRFLTRRRTKSAWPILDYRGRELIQEYRPMIGTPMLFLFGTGTLLFRRNHDFEWESLVRKSLWGISRVRQIPNGGTNFPETHFNDTLGHIKGFLELTSYIEIA